MSDWVCPLGHELNRKKINELISTVSAFCPVCKSPTVYVRSDKEEPKDE